MLLRHDMDNKSEPNRKKNDHVRCFWRSFRSKDPLIGCMGDLWFCSTPLDRGVFSGQIKMLLMQPLQFRQGEELLGGLNDVATTIFFIHFYGLVKGIDTFFVSAAYK